MKQGLAKMFLASVEVGNLCAKIRNNEKIVSADIVVDYRAPRNIYHMIWFIKLSRN